MARLDISFAFKSVYQKFRTSSQKQQWEEAMIFFCFVLLAAGFWYLESLQNDYEIDIVIPVKYTNTPQDVLLSGNNPQDVQIRVRDKGTVLVNYMWFNSFSPIEIDLKDLHAEQKRNVVLERRVIESAISRQLIASTSLLQLEPPAIQVDYITLKHKNVPVAVNIDLQTAPGYQQSDAIRVKPDVVHVYANNVVTDTLSAIQTEHIEIKKAHKTVMLTVRLKQIPDVRIEPEKVEVTIPIEEFTEKRFKIPVRCKNLPENYTLRVFPASVEVCCKIPLSKYKYLEDSDIEIQIPFREFEENHTRGELPVRLTKHPAWVDNPLIDPNAVEFILEKKNL